MSLTTRWGLGSPGRRSHGGLRGLDSGPRERTAPAPSPVLLVVWVLLMPLLVLVQVTLLAFLPVPWAVPDLVLVAVLGLAHHRGALGGGLVGAWAGLLLDVVPPAAGGFGGWTLVLGTIGCAYGHVVATRRPGPILSMGLMALAAAATTCAHALVLWFSGVPVGPLPLLRAALGAAAWALLLAPIALLVTGGRIATSDPRHELHREPTLLDAVTPGWAAIGRPSPQAGVPVATSDGTAS